MQPPVRPETVARLTLQQQATIREVVAETSPTHEFRSFFTQTAQLLQKLTVAEAYEVWDWFLYNSPHYADLAPAARMAAVQSLSRKYSCPRCNGTALISVNLVGGETQTHQCSCQDGLRTFCYEGASS